MAVLQKIKDLSSMHNVSLAELERRTGLSSGSITKWSKSSPSVDKIEKIANYFNVTIDYLLGREDSYNEDPVSFFRIDTTNLTHDEISELQSEMEDYQEFIKNKIKSKRRG